MSIPAKLPPASARQSLEAGLYRGAAALETIADRLCPEQLLRRDVIRLVLEAFWDGTDLAEPMAPGPRLFLANHQTSMDPFYIGATLAALRQEPVILVVTTFSRYQHTGDFAQQALALPGDKNSCLEDLVRRRFVDTRQQENVAKLWLELQRDLQTGDQPPSIVICVEGHQQTSDPEPVSIMGSDVLDLAIRSGVPITPVRFAWGLPQVPLEHVVFWTYKLAPQRFFVGREILPEALAGLSLPQRKGLVLGAINALRRPSPAGHFQRNAAMDSRVRKIVEMCETSRTKAIALDLLMAADPATLSVEGRQVREWVWSLEATKGHYEDDRLFRFALWLGEGLHTAVNLPLEAVYPSLMEEGEAA